MTNPFKSNSNFAVDGTLKPAEADDAIVLAVIRINENAGLPRARKDIGISTTAALASTTNFCRDCRDGFGGDEPREKLRQMWRS
eukprot:m.46637 g.46637  ORF g.46637 m.46637 type:complete len:84 (-) comp15175_c0_seq1:38-289(-)